MCCCHAEHCQKRRQQKNEIYVPSQKKIWESSKKFGENQFMYFCLLQKLGYRVSEAINYLKSFVRNVDYSQKLALCFFGGGWGRMGVEVV
jgi:intergrase/recombinase